MAPVWHYWNVHCNAQTILLSLGSSWQNTIVTEASSLNYATEANNLAKAI